MTESLLGVAGGLEGPAWAIVDTRHSAEARVRRWRSAAVRRRYGSRATKLALDLLTQ